MQYRVEQVAPARTFALHQAVLRPWMSLDEVARTEPGIATFAAVSVPGEQVISCATLYRDEPPQVVPADARAGRAGYRLRAMATAEEHRGEGVGSAVLVAVLEEVARQGGGLLWCHAREKAVRFYGAMGLAVAGEPFSIERIGVHVVMWCLVDGSAKASSNSKAD